MITIRDVARHANVSVATVSRVLNNSALVSQETRETVMQAVAQLGYRPNANAQALATQVSDTIGVIVMDVSDAFFGALVKAVDTVAQEHQKYVLIGNSYHEAEKERHAIEVLIRQRCNALIVHSKALSDEELTGFMEQIPGMVLINRVVPGYAHRCVCLDNVSGAVMATRMLLNNGHQRIGYLASSHQIEDNDSRREGWFRALEEQGIAAPDSWVGTGSPDMQGGEAAMVELLGRNLQLTAVFAYNDSMAAGALTALKDNGIAVPQHLSLIGFDDIPIARYTDPQLTTVRYPVASMARLATELALQGAAGKLDPQAAHCFMPTLVRRHSVALRQSVAPITNS
ncbi:MULTISPECIES: HTH-type transcriptional regulator GalS [Kosakonia]|jgi:LacI family transcriptional regulator|uniref:DNA-binding transcriptional regulator GalS n=1 Tax=Kosakonia cowanii JCM 10956 = DSM 18146 TaxID=1300165 RepID=A0A830Z9G1_9ENTR|nr:MULTISPECIES: HTH-type transcriptional regulator GalS [Kosakonia]MDP9767338.1 LacI family transcriptional regulator [Atlantibacter hermannii]MDT3412883.1 LacI family transcriptional regulator [Atlantibacter sp. SORGH_AS_0304]APZ07271.1 DNA-binding transcriptional regulator GalS [Kosakonia cowanii JCM 10956 = DSM 18146]AST70030.1 HTH-type transcriptional regulator GalS [Kosakonia cowanii]MBK0016289.1 HTH-type transcriptional regulator GalS [Kosakonia sp. S42]